MTAGEVYEQISKLREELKEFQEARSAVEEVLGDKHRAYTLLDKQVSDKIEEIRKTEAIKLAITPSVSNDQFWADTPASRPF